MQIKHLIAFAFSNKQPLFIPPAAAATPPTSVTSPQRIKDVIKHHQSQARGYGRTRTRGPPPTLVARELRRDFGLSSQTQEARRPVSSRQVKGQINRSGGFWSCPPDLWGQDAASSAVNWKGGTRTCRPGPFLCSRGPIRRWHISH